MRTETLKKISMQLGRGKHSNKLKSIEESYKLLDTHVLSKLKPKTLKQVKHIYKVNEIKTVIKSVLTTIKSPDSYRLSDEFYKNQIKNKTYLP